MTVLQGLQLADTLSQRNKLKEAHANQNKQLEEVLPGVQQQKERAQTVSDAVERLSRDLLQLADGTNEASKIVAEFKIQLNNPPQGGESTQNSTKN